MLCLITGILFFVTGECTWVIVVNCILGGLLAELIRKVLGCHSFKGISLAGGFTALGLIGSPLPMWLFQEAYMKSIIEMGMAKDYVAHQLFGDSVEAEFSLLNREIPEAAIESILSALHLLDYRDHHPMTLSGGQKQRLAISAAALSGRQVLIFDEPTSGLDYGNLCQVSQLIRALAKDRIVFIATHDRELVNLLCTKELSICGKSAQLVSYGA